MRRADRWRMVWPLAAAFAVGPVPAAEEPLLRHRADIAIEQSAAFVQMPLPPSVYVHSLRSGLQDLRVVDARGERVPFAWLAARPDEAQPIEQPRAATLYPLPSRPAAGAAWVSPVEVTVDGDRISVKRRSGIATAPGLAAVPGWLVDLGERRRDDPVPQSLRLQWSGPNEFTTAYVLEVSDDLRQWRRGGSGQVMALAGDAGALTQPVVSLPAAPGRFVRLVWSDPGAAPMLTAASSVNTAQRQVTLDAPTELVVAASVELPTAPASDVGARRALHFDLGAPLPLVQLDLQLGPGTRVAPVRLQARTRTDEPWQPVAGAVFYRLERPDEIASSPPLALRHTLRYLRVVPDERAAALDAAQTRLVVRAQLGSLVFAAQGQAPYALLAGSTQASAGALPLATLVPSLADERPRFGRASLGAWSEVPAAARQAEADQCLAALRPALLWAVLLAGVMALAWMVWRLSRRRAVPEPAEIPTGGTRAP